jgi:hypothetical protein
MQSVIRMDFLPVKRHAKKSLAFHSAFKSIFKSSLNNGSHTTIYKSEETLRGKQGSCGIEGHQKRMSSGLAEAADL